MPRRRYGIPWVFVIWNLGLGVVCLASAPSRYGYGPHAQPHVARSLVGLVKLGRLLDNSRPMVPWGILFILIGTSFILGWRYDTQRIMRNTLRASGYLASGWALLFLFAARDPNAFPSGVITFGTFAFLHLRCIRYDRTGPPVAWPLLDQTPPEA